jgi:integrase
MNDLTLSKAREKADQVRAALASGIDPKAAFSPPPSPEPESTKTFGECAEDYIARVEYRWRNLTHRKQWRQSLQIHAAGIWNMPVSNIGTGDVLAVLEPIWATKSETASRVRGRIEKILSAAKVRGLRSGDSINPAQWKGHLDAVLGERSRLTRGHHAALPFIDAPAFMIQLRARPALAARCLEFVILTAARSGEALGATWGEIDFAKRLWTVPAARMKAGAEHVVPLSPAAVALLEDLKPENPESSGIIFGVGGGPARSNMAMAMLLRRMKRGDLTTHGFRSTFRDWAGDATEHPRDLVEAALAHTIQNKAERAYRRGTAIERRRGLMEQWAEYLDSAPAVSSDDFDALLNERSG